MEIKDEIANVVAKRLREVRQKKNISQEKLGVMAGIDEFSASAMYQILKLLSVWQQLLIHQCLTFMHQMMIWLIGYLHLNPIDLDKLKSTNLILF